MNLCLAEVLDSAALARLRAQLALSVFVEGAATAGWHAQGVKHNQQAAADDAPAAAASRNVQAALLRHPLFTSALLPRRLRLPLIARYRLGMDYGWHVDNALMGAEGLRADLAVTVFLSEPEDYDGGELVIEKSDGEQTWKLAAGQALVYPATSLHRVAPVTRGERLVAVTWVESQVRDAAQRELLFDLDRARRSLFERHGKTHEFDLLAKCHANLLRAWAG